MKQNIIVALMFLVLVSLLCVISLPKDISVPSDIDLGVVDYRSAKASPEYKYMFTYSIRIGLQYGTNTCYTLEEVDFIEKGDFLAILVKGAENKGFCKSGMALSGNQELVFSSEKVTFISKKIK